LIDFAKINLNLMPRLGDLSGRALRPARLYFETMEGVELPSSGRGRRYWVVSRGLCRFFRVPLLTGADRASQLDALALEIKRLSPFEETGSHFHLAADFASAWLWDQRATRSAAASAGIDVARLRVVPEPALLPAVETGVRLVETLDGAEGQYWSGGGLSASRWWPRLPDGPAWMLFQRGASVPPEEVISAVPVPLRQPWLARPWTRTRSSASFDLSQLDMHLVAAGIAVALLAAYGYQGARYLHVRHDAAIQAEEIAPRSAAIEPVLAARTRALDDLAAINTLRELDRFPSQLALMARVAETLPAGGAHLDDWLYDRGQLELSIASDQPLDVVRLVRSLEEGGYFSGVAAERSGNNNTLRLRASVAAR
jgi:hypothetical protein